MTKLLPNYSLSNKLNHPLRFRSYEDYLMSSLTQFLIFKLLRAAALIQHIVNRTFNENHERFKKLFSLKTKEGCFEYYLRVTFVGY